MKVLLCLCVLLALAAAHNHDGNELTAISQQLESLSVDKANLETVLQTKKEQVEIIKSKDKLTKQEKNLLAELKESKDATAAELEEVQRKMDKAAAAREKLYAKQPALHGNRPALVGEGAPEPEDRNAKKALLIDANPRTISLHPDLDTTILKTKEHQKEEHDRELEKLRQSLEKKAEARKWSVEHGHPFRGQVKPDTNHHAGKKSAPVHPNAKAISKKNVEGTPIHVNMPDISKMGTTYEAYTYRHFLGDSNNLAEFATESSYGCAARCSHSEKCHSWTWFHNVSMCVTSMGRPGARHQEGVPTENIDGAIYKPLVFSGMKEHKAERDEVKRENPTHNMTPLEKVYLEKKLSEKTAKATESVKKGKHYHH